MCKATIWLLIIALLQVSCMDNSCVFLYTSGVQPCLCVHSTHSTMERFLSEDARPGWKVVFYGDGLTTETKQVSAGTSHPARSQNPGAPLALVPGSKSQQCVQGTESLGLPSF